MKVQSILKEKAAEVITIGRQAAIHQDAQLMSTANVGALVVTDGDKVVGMLTNRDIVNAFSRHGWRLSDLQVPDIIRPGFVSIAPDDSLKQVMALMTRRRATHTPVLANNRLTGIISIGDVVKHRLEELELETNVLRDAYIAVH
jgi:CBS domain-containing protein